MKTCEDCGQPTGRGGKWKRCHNCADAALAAQVARRAESRVRTATTQARNAVQERRRRKLRAVQEQAPGWGPLADTEWRRWALRAVETWETFGANPWTLKEWCDHFGQVDRQHVRFVAAMNDYLGIEVRVVLVPFPSTYQFTFNAIDRLRLVAELLDRYLAAKKEPPCSSEPALHPTESSSSNSRAS